VTASELFTNTALARYISFDQAYTEMEIASVRGDANRSRFYRLILALVSAEAE